MSADPDLVKTTLEDVILKGLLDSKASNNTIQLALDAGLVAKYFFDTYARKVATHVLEAYEEDASQPDLFEIHDKFQHDRLTMIMGKIHEPDHFEKRINELGRVTRRREALEAVDVAKRMIEAGTGTTEDILNALQEKSEGIISDGAQAMFYTAKQGMQAVMEDVQTAVKNKGMFGLSSPYPEMDTMLRGFQPGRVYVVAAESGGGKSVLCMNIAARQITDRNRTAIFSLEMSYRDVWARMAIHHAKVSGNAMSGVQTLNKGDIKNLTSLAQIAEHIPIITCDKAGLAVESVVASLHREHRKEPLKLACIDYVQLMHSRKKHNSREQEIAYISRCLKGAAMDLGIAIVLPCQLNDDGKARESRGIKFDSDAFIHIKDEELLIEKNRVGPTGALPYQMNGEFQRFDKLYTDNA